MNKSQTDCTHSNIIPETYDTFIHKSEGHMVNLSHSENDQCRTNKFTSLLNERDTISKNYFENMFSDSDSNQDDSPKNSQFDFYDEYLDQCEKSWSGVAMQKSPIVTLNGDFFPENSPIVTLNGDFFTTLSPNGLLQDSPPNTHYHQIKSSINNITNSLNTSSLHQVCSSRYFSISCKIKHIMIVFTILFFVFS